MEDNLILGCQCKIIIYFLIMLQIEQKTGKEVTADLLLSASISLARYLQNQGVTNEDIIAIITENTWKYYVVLTAGLFLGVPVYAINPDYNSSN